MTAVIASPDGKTLAAAYLNGTIRLWDAASHRLISTATWSGRVLALAFGGHGQSLVIAGPAATGTWNLRDGAKITARPLAGLTPGSPGAAGSARPVPARPAPARPAASQRPVPSRSARTAPPWPPAARTGTSGCGTWPRSRRSARR